jgi:hypothetical protein
MQQAICEVLRGKGRRVYKAGPLDTKELLAELVSRGVLDDETRPHKHLMATVVRACWSLESRGLLSGAYVVDADDGRTTIEWSAR